MKKFILFLGDTLSLYLSLWIALFIRDQSFINLFWSFSLIFIIWLLILYIAGLYDFEINNDRLKFYSLLWKVLAINMVIAIIIFYIGPGPLDITPKRVLLINIIIFGILFIGWRYIWRLFSKKFPENVLIIGKTSRISHPNYNFIFIDQIFNFKKLIKEKNIQTVVLASNPHLNPATTAELFNCLPIKFMDLTTFYEQIFKKIPISNVSRVWFLENINAKHAFEMGKRMLDIIISMIGFISLPLWVIIAILIKWDSRGSIFYKQIRTGKNNKEFKVIKFRTMVENAEKGQAKWAEKDDPRITKIGRFLRKTRLDELPQLINILMGDMSLVGPRPERPEFIKDLKKQIPFYEIRHLIKPGLTGWAQIRYKYGNSIEDSKEKLRYDLYYIKNRSIILDLAVILKTINIVLSRNGS